MNEWLFLCSSALVFSLLIVVGWRFLPGDRFQVLATVPVRRCRDGRWQGINFTWYGLILATAAVVGLLFVLILTLAAGMAPEPVLAVLVLIVGLCLPAARWMARIVEKKKYTFTIGGAFFCGLVATPAVILLVNGGCLVFHVPTVNMEVMLAALAIGYILGEGLGRLACLSFGCCYGKPLHQCGRLTGWLFERTAVVFTGSTKKAVYEGGLAGVKLVPIQGLTCILYTSTALVSTSLFLQDRARSAFLLSLLVSQVWRVFSEILRADFRGFSAFSAYQKMSLAAIAYGGLLCLLLPHASRPLPVITNGLILLANPFLLLGMQVVWLTLFVHFGRSMVTGATLSFEVHRNRT